MSPRVTVVIPNRNRAAPLAQAGERGPQDEPVRLVVWTMAPRTIP